MEDRLASEERICSLQALVDQTFKQFAMDDSEDEDFEEDYSAGESFSGESDSIETADIPVYDMYSPTTVPTHVRHIRSNSTHFQ